jgi:hypothetical protein
VYEPACPGGSPSAASTTGNLVGSGGPASASNTAASVGPTPRCNNSVNTLAGSPASPGWVLGIDKKSGILIQTGDGVLAVSMLQYQSRKALSWRDFLNGSRDFIGSCLSSNL